ncbi:beta-N-acetylhexosaminidase [Microvirga aerophila]|uniref:beta-N-acetylhexosaminidase n=1 Tax=Microvirga aerophila TaxID=670291 RepID=A0A512BRE7_9HYPH|nr:beta-N-acetylhexosaminidase [Microvirga aerophila]GEO14484.1 glycosyl hydrolase [Microvirga aerophila]
MITRAFIAGCSSQELTPDEIAFFREANPWGFILFRRNIDNPAQVKALCDALRDTVGRADAPILIDQEGGRVQRMGPPHWPKYPPGRSYGQVHSNDPLVQREIARLGARLIAHDLRSVGITVDCLPVLDVPSSGSHDIIGDRAYGKTAEQVAVLGRAAAEGLLAGGVLPVIKHMPGHGRAGADSHLSLPVVDASREALETHDFKPFRMLTDMPLAMTAHVVYTAIDPERPATTSPTVIHDIIRGHIGYQGLVMSDDLSMEALSGSLRERAEAAFAAGCDVGLHCNGKMEEMSAVAEAAPALEGEALRRAAAALQRITHDPEPLDPVDARARLDAALAMVA